MRNPGDCPSISTSTGTPPKVGADIYVEDTPENLRRLRRGGHYAICFANSTNRDIAAPRAATWRDVYELIKDREPVGRR